MKHICTILQVDFFDVRFCVDDLYYHEILLKHIYEYTYSSYKKDFMAWAYPADSKSMGLGLS